MSDGIMLVLGEDGVAREYDDTWDITIHCESEEEQKAVWEKLNNLNREVKNSTDTIYRQDAIDALEKWESESTWDEWCYDHKDEAEKYNIISPSSVVFVLPSAQPQRKTGTWNRYYRMHSGDTFVCNRCGSCFMVIQGADKMNFCPNCGSDMRGEQE